MDSLLSPNATPLELNIEHSIAGHLDIPVVLKNCNKTTALEYKLLKIL